MWIFGYGSLLWYTDFPYTHVTGGTVHGFARRFWQLSPDHRGTPIAPCRTVTLVSEKEEKCWGKAYEVASEHEKDTLAYLDHREKAGYSCVAVLFHPDDGSDPFEVLVYISPGGDNKFHAGPTDVDEIASTILVRKGPSGTNIEYALKIACQLRLNDASDAHVFDVERRILELASERRTKEEDVDYVQKALCALGYVNTNGKWTAPVEKKVF